MAASDTMFWLFCYFAKLLALINMFIFPQTFDAYDTHGYAFWIYYYSLVVIGSFFMLNLVLGVLSGWVFLKSVFSEDSYSWPSMVSSASVQWKCSRLERDLNQSIKLRLKTKQGWIPYQKIDGNLLMIWSGSLISTDLLYFHFAYHTTGSFMSL